MTATGAATNSGRDAYGSWDYTGPLSNPDDLSNSGGHVWVDGGWYFPGQPETFHYIDQTLQVKYHLHWAGENAPDTVKVRISVNGGASAWVKPYQEPIYDGGGTIGTAYAYASVTSDLGNAGPIELTGTDPENGNLLPHKDLWQQDWADDGLQHGERNPRYFPWW